MQREVKDQSGKCKATDQDAKMLDARLRTQDSRLWTND
jgi:hypothetical protein